jgi:hypothetical protein
MQGRLAEMEDRRSLGEKLKQIIVHEAAFSLFRISIWVERAKRVDLFEAANSLRD